MFVKPERRNNATNIKGDQEGTSRRQGKQLVSNPCAARPKRSVSTNTVIEIRSELCMIQTENWLRPMINLLTAQAALL